MPVNVRAQVGAINDLYRTALLNRRYYAQRLKTLKTWTKTFDVVIAVGTSSTLAGWVIWKTTAFGALLWGVLAGVAAIASLLKPILQLPREVERYSKLHISYCSLYYDLDTLIFELNQNRAFAPTLWKMFLQLRKKNNELGLQDDPHPHEELLRACQREVLKEVPAGSLWLPTKDEAAVAQTA